MFDSEPRVVSNLIVDQTSTNPAAKAAAGIPVRTQGNEGVTPCTTDPDPLADPPVLADPPDCTPTGQTLFIPNVTTDVGLSPPYNSLFTLFGQFFDHGVDQTVKGGGTVFVPLKADDPLITVGPDHKANTGDEVPPEQAFMVLTRAQNQPGDDGVLGTADDRQDAENTDSPWVDQSQTYTSHSSHQVFLREYDLVGGKPVSTGKLLGGPVEAGWPHQHRHLGRRQGAGSHQAGAEARRPGRDSTSRCSRPTRTATSSRVRTVCPSTSPPADWSRATSVHPWHRRQTSQHFDTPFLTDIAHNADPSPQDTDHNPGTPKVAPDSGRGQHGVGGLREPAAGHVRRRDAERALLVW